MNQSKTLKGESDMERLTEMTLIYDPVSLGGAIRKCKQAFEEGVTEVTVDIQLTKSGELIKSSKEAFVAEGWSVRHDYKHGLMDRFTISLNQKE